MKRLITVILVLIVPALFAENCDVALKEVIEGMNGPYAPVDQSPARPMVQTSRGLGDILLTIDALALGIDGPSGITWDGTYLYVMSLMNDSCYVVDPTVPAVVYGFPTPPTNSFGIGQEQHLWLTCLTTDSIYEYTHVGVPTGNGFPALEGDASWFADGSEWWQDGEIWFVAVGGTNNTYKFEIPSGTVLDSMSHPRWASSAQRGITYDPFRKTFWIGGWVSDSVWEVDRNGVPTGREFYMDGCAGIAYDWQSTLHPYPVLWI
ncbi:MAG: hypothetical protein JSV97_02375 [candidate division WOR-3 bacterium]|nr:MAG: hypothetical protein JSV97_02375 [candidate division WOR-3 bacterium]